MFTGIIRHLGQVKNIRHSSDGSVGLEIVAPFSRTLHEGDSVAVNGVCLTALFTNDTTWTCRLMAETLKKTTLGFLKTGATLNLELPAKAGDSLDGHIVQGHVEGVCEITDISAVGDDRVFTFRPPQSLVPHIIPKGSIALDGVSLTIVDVHEDTFTVSIMPYTLEHTTFGTRTVGDRINIETDSHSHTVWYAGKVVHGDGRGTGIGFPTANITFEGTPNFTEEGIFACRAMIEDDPTVYAAALHIGPRPTFEGATPSVELHILCFPSQTLYGRRIQFTIVQKIRDIQKFKTQKELTAAIEEDVRQARNILLQPPQ
jgi:riboflavin synthase alpha subunit